MTDVTRVPVSPRTTAVSTVAAAAVLAVLTPLATGTATGSATLHQVYKVPKSGAFTLDGRGDGHGHGMSQWGAYGAASVDHLSADKILAFYYPHTKLRHEAAEQHVRVLLSAADSAAHGYLEVRPSAGLTIDIAGKTSVLPAKSPKGAAITAWRLKQDGESLELRRHDAGKWRDVETAGTSARFSDTAAVVPVVLPGSVTVGYRGTMRAELIGEAVETVDRVSMEEYLRSVVPAEMPASWSSAAVAAQAVASRTYAAYGVAHPKASWYDVDGDTRDQAYLGVPREAAASDAAIKATAREVLVDSSGQPIFAQFGAADGGWTASGGESYLPAQQDPYDGLIPNDGHSWSRQVPASTIEAAYPSVGKLRELVVTGRDGHGAWGGRITQLQIVGKKATVDVAGQDFQWALGLENYWWKAAA